MAPLGIHFLPYSTTSPWSNGAAEMAKYKNPFENYRNKKILKIPGMNIFI